MKEGMPTIPLPKDVTEEDVRVMQQQMNEEAKARSEGKYNLKFTRQEAIDRIVTNRVKAYKQADAALEEAKENLDRKAVGDINKYQ